eukprot:scaffold153663_cov17-Tisochrysis_lutea.AAC.1
MQQPSSAHASTFSCSARLCSSVGCSEPFNVIPAYCSFAIMKQSRAVHRDNCLMNCGNLKCTAGTAGTLSCSERLCSSVECSKLFNVTTV